MRTEQRAFGGVLCLLFSDWSLRWFDVCICTDASETGSRFVKDVVSWPVKSVVSRSGRGSRSSRYPPSVPRRQMSIWKSQVRTRMRGRLPEECRADFPEVSLQLMVPSKWRLADFGAFFREENIIVLEVQSILLPSSMRRVDVRQDAQ